MATNFHIRFGISLASLPGLFRHEALRRRRSIAKGALVARIRQFISKSRFPLCSLCNEPVELRTAKTDELGKAVHEECYALKMQPNRPLLVDRPPTRRKSLQ